MPSSKPIILITHEFRPFRGGVGTYCWEFASALRNQGAEVEVWCPDFRQQHPDDPKWVRRLPGKGGLKFTSQWHFGRSILRHREELRGKIVLLPSVGSQILFMLLAGFLPPHRLCSLWHGSEIPRFDRFFLWRTLAPRLFERCLLTCNSDFTRKLAIESPLAQPDQEIHILPCGPDRNAVQPVESKTMEDHKIRILTLARLHPRKGHLDVINALGQLSEAARASVMYQVAGTGKSGYEKRLTEAARLNKVQLEILGEISDGELSLTYAQCDFFAMTSRTLDRSVEGFGITYIEAGFHHKPSVAYRTGGVTEAILHEKTGLLVEEGDIPALTSALQRLIEDRPYREKLGHAARHHAMEFCWEKTARKFLDLL